MSVRLQLFILGNDLRIIPAVPGSRPQIDNPGLGWVEGRGRGRSGLSFTFHFKSTLNLASRDYDSQTGKGVLIKI